jgi:uracil-DNA glycosylase family 4
VSRDEAIRELAAVYREVAEAADAVGTGQVPRVLIERGAVAEVACVAESIGPRTQLLTGIPWVLPSGQLSDKGSLLDTELLRHIGYTADPRDKSRRYAYFTDVSHLWLGRTEAGKLRRPRNPDKAKCAPWLERELQAVQPQVVLLMGRHAAPFFLRCYARIRVSRLQDVVAQPFPCRVGEMQAVAVATWHPTGAQCHAGGPTRAYAPTARVVADLLADA